jgi:hypothetical protein
MNWVTWQNVGVDRIACAWLIRRCIDQAAYFNFIPEDQIPSPELGEAFDLPGVRLSHRRGHATFQTILEEYKIQDPILHRMARIINEADTVQEVLLEPIAFGLDRIATGLRLSSHDDTEASEKGKIVFDALYAVLEQENL